MSYRTGVRTPRLLLAALMTAVLGLLASLVVAPPAGASSTLLCKGFSACAAAGYSSYGYGPDEFRKSFWRMYSGHNCTNYVAYRMIRNGMSTERPWSGSGDARNWGVVFADKTDQKPMIGSVAWWSSASHVAYVQRIIDADTIVVSEDHWGGDFNWRKITRAGGGWPTGFIHLADERLVARFAPKVVGTPQVDEPLTARPGLWNSSAPTFAYQWNADGVAIPGANGTTYQPTAEQVGAEFTVRVVASKAGFRKGVSSSSQTAPAAPGVMDISSVPVVDGFPKVGAVLTAVEAVWAPAADTATYYWFADGRMLKGATGPTLEVSAAHLDKKISVVARGTRAGYEDSVARSAQTAPIGPESIAIDAEPRLVTQTPYIGKAFRVAAGTATPSDVTTRYQWYAGEEKIPGATEATFTPTIEQMSARLKVGIAYSKPGYTPVYRTLAAEKPVKAFPRIYISSRSANSITVVVRADGIPVVYGRVSVTGPDGQKVIKDLSKGMMSVTASWLTSGPLELTVGYVGTYRIEGRHRTAVIGVR